MKIVATDFPNGLQNRDFRFERELLAAQLGKELRFVVHPYTDKAGLMEVLRDADGVLNAFVPFDAEVIAACARLRGISIDATGYQAIDLAACDEKGIEVFAIAEYCTNEVADHCMAFLLALSRNLKFYANQIDREANWSYAAAPTPHRLSTQTLGIVGFGKIGRAVARRAQGFGMRVLAYDPYVTKEAGAAYGAEVCEMAQLLAESDYISNHMAATKENEKFFCRACFAQMQKKPYFLNLGRGVSVDESDLIAALDAGQLAGAALDVLYEESPDVSAHPLAGRDNVILTPHAAFYSAEAFRDLQEISCMNLVYCLQGRAEKAVRRVNHPR